MTKPRPYIDRGMPGKLRYQGGQLLEVKLPQNIPQVIVTLQSIRRHNTLEPPLQPTHRILLRWSESLGTGMPNPDADRRETHYDPLSPDLQQKVDDIVDVSPWHTLVHKRYRTNLEIKALAELLCVSRAQLYSDLRASLWYFTGRFQAEKIYG
jgi:hypothetical protein